MTDMRRVTISFPYEMDRAILDLKKERDFERCSYNEIVRTLVAWGIVAMRDYAEKKGQPEGLVPTARCPVTSCD